MSKMHFRFSLTPPNPSLILLEGQTTAALSLALMVIFISGDQYNVPGTEVPLSSCRSVLPASTAVNGNLFAKCPPFAISPAGRVGSQGGQLDMRAPRLLCFTAGRRMTARGSQKPSRIQSGLLTKEQSSHGMLCRENYLCVFLAV